MTYQIMYYQLSNEELSRKMRLALTDTTCFFTREVAEQAIHDNIKHHADIISSWLFDESPNASQRLRINYEHTKPIGYGLSWETKERVENISHSYIILKKSKFEHHEEGFYIIFAAPDLKEGGQIE